MIKYQDIADDDPVLNHPRLLKSMENAIVAGVSATGNRSTYLVATKALLKLLASKLSPLPSLLCASVFASSIFAADQ